MKRIILIPILHSAADLGSLSESVRSYYVERFGQAIWHKRERAIEKLWSDIKKKLRKLKLDYRKVRIYQDGLPLCARELDIVKELAGAGSRNHQIVLDLLSKGATLVGTEDPELLIKEYEAQRQQIDTVAAGRTGSDEGAHELLQARDRFIARRIVETLQDGEVGLVFLGAAHQLGAFSSSGVQVETLTPTATKAV